MKDKLTVDDYFERFRNKFDAYNCNEEPTDSCINNRYVISFGVPPKDSAMADKYSELCERYARNIGC